MQKKLHQSLTVFMAFLVLLSSTGFGFMEHECMMQGKSVKFLTEKNAALSSKKGVSSCCARSKALRESKGVFIKKTSCCKENPRFEKLDVSSSIQYSTAKLLKSQVEGILFLPWLSTPVRNYFTFSPQFKSSHIISFSSRLHGRSMLSFVQSLLI